MLGFTRWLTRQWEAFLMKSGNPAPNAEDRAWAAVVRAQEFDEWLERRTNETLCSDRTWLSGQDL